MTAHVALLERTTSETQLKDSTTKAKSSYGKVLDRASSTTTLPKHIPHTEAIITAKIEGTKKPAKPVYDSSAVAAKAGQFANNSAALVSSNSAAVSADVILSTKTSSLATRLSKK